MFLLFNLTASLTPTPEETATPTPGDGASLRPGLDPSQVTPGTLGFLFTLFVVVACIFLIRDMVKRIRRVRYRTMAEEAAMDEGQPVERREADGTGQGGAHRRDTPPGVRTPGGRHGPESS